LGVWDFKILGGWNVGAKSVEGSDPPVPVSVYNVSPRVSGDPSGVGTSDSEVWSVVSRISLRRLELRGITSEFDISGLQGNVHRKKKGCSEPNVELPSSLCVK
jgi:hypothetical protein